MNRKKHKDNISLEEAVDLLRSVCAPRKETLQVSLAEACGAVLAEDIYAPISQPPFDRAPVDGYAVLSEDICRASRSVPVSLEVIGQVNAGDAFRGHVSSGQAVRIMTGAPIPPGCDACVRQEDTDYGEVRVQIYTPCRAGDNYCRAGEDFIQGQKLLTAGTRLGATEIALLAQMGLESVPVFKKPAVALFTTGDELIAPGTPLTPGKIYNSNLFGLRARMQELGIKLVQAGHLPDEPESAAKSIAQAALLADMIVTTGGVSVGKKDIMHDVLDILGARQLFWGIAMKPGMPALAAVIGNTPLIGLSGNPFGALATFELLVRPVLAWMGRDDALCTRRIAAVLDHPFPKESRCRRFVRAHYSDGCPGGRVTLPEGSHSSGILTSMRHCNCLIDIPAGSPPLTPGTLVDVILLQKYTEP